MFNVRLVNFIYSQTLWTFISFIQLCAGLEIALFASSGCYSHDQMLIETGQGFVGHNISWFQAQSYQFSASPIKIPTDWNKLVLKRVGKEDEEIKSTGGSLLWNMNLPLDFSKPWDLRGNLLFFNILRIHHRVCKEFVQSNMFKKYLLEKRADLIVIDHFIQECFVATSHLLNTTSVMFSNWPLADGYLTAINIPANPSVVPKTGTAFSSLHMSFFDRVCNTIFHSLIVAARHIHAHYINYLFAQLEYSDVDLDKIQAKHLLYAGRSEFFAEAIRPRTNRLKNFGCVLCRYRSDYQITQPFAIVSEVKSSLNDSRLIPLNVSSGSQRLPQHVVELHKNITLLVPAIATQSKQQFCSHECSVQREKVGSNQTNIKIQHSALEKILIEGNLTEAERRYVETQLTFKDLDLSLLDEGPFVLVSFGSVALTCYMPAELLDRFLETFKQLAPLRFVWQTNSKPEDLLGQREAPDNLILVQWAPIKVLLAHSNLQYAVLHGGVNTLNELLFFGVPTLGVPLQGDQPSNVNRLKELGMADMITIGELYKPGAFAEKLLQFQKDLPRLRTRAHKVSSMISTYRELNGNGQNFWLYWAQRHGKRVQSSTTTGQKRSFFEQELRTAADYFAIKEVTIWSTLTLCLLFLISN